jgi:hypothetical protein
LPGNTFEHLHPIKSSLQRAARVFYDPPALAPPKLPSHQAIEAPNQTCFIGAICRFWTEQLALQKRDTEIMIGN